jgi:KEOPS complex subunit Cgi121
LRFELAEFKCKVWISAFEGKVDVASVMKEANDRFPDAAVQFFDLDRVAGSRHLLLAAYNAMKSYNSSRRITRSLGMEVLLFVSGTRQITLALERVGINADTMSSAVMVLAASDEAIECISDMLIERFHQNCNDKLLDTWTGRRRELVQRVFGIGMKELKATNRTGGVEKAIEKLAIERSAMLAVAK